MNLFMLSIYIFPIGTYASYVMFLCISLQLAVALQLLDSSLGWLMFPLMQEV